ncbi:MAG: hypothetical protein K1X78_21945 [Verrucomicrobiaceae bacterium]|nr:hypothetical protein [Verrucomicrobiaceae bacterium]
MKQCSFAVWVGLSALFVTNFSISAEPKDTIGKPASRPIRDAPFFAKQAKEDAENWRMYLKKFCREPDLESLKSEKGLEVYRFIYQPCFHQHLCLTAKVVEKKVVLEIRRFSEKGKLELSGSLEFDDQAVEGFRREFGRPEICDPLRGLTDSQRDNLPMVLDGATWHLETLRDGKYTHAALYSPDAFESLTKEERTEFKRERGFDVPDLREFVFSCLEFVSHSGLPLDAVYYEPMPRARK